MAEAAALAVETAEQQMFESIPKNADAWDRELQREKAASEIDATNALKDLRAAFIRRSDAVSTMRWLASGPRERAPKLGLLGEAVGSEHSTGNRARVDVGLVLDWLAQTIAPPEPPSETETPDQQQPVTA
jgi:hypothetical protein